MKNGDFPQLSQKGTKGPNDFEEYVADVIDLDLSVLTAVHQESRFSIVFLDGIYEVKLEGRRNIGILGPDAAAWVSTRRIIKVQTHSWSNDSGYEFLKVRISAAL